ncbi:MAG: hypothetical protein WCL57_05515 [Chloroflexota bacterium]|jgi:uncharacterized protein YqjF (DUF2071 family)
MDRCRAISYERCVRPHYLPSVPKLLAFPELNVRTYVIRDGKAMHQQQH